jgi:hypothetical protein
MFIKRNNPVDVLSEDEAYEILHPYLLEFHDCIVKAWSRWERLAADQPEIRKGLGPVSRASFVNDWIRENLKEAFSGRAKEGVRIHEKGRLLMVCIKGKINVRFKKMTPALMTSNINTDQQLGLQFQRSLPGIPEATHLSCGYVLDALGAAIDLVAVTCRVGKALRYCIPVAAAERRMTPFTAASEDAEPSGAKVRAIIEPKKTNAGGA